MELIILILFIIFSFYLSLNFNKKINNLDKPGKDKIQSTATITSGGLFANILFFIIFIFFIHYNHGFSEYIFSIPKLYIVAISFMLLTALSFYDDYKGIPFQVRLAIQIIVVFISISSFPINELYNFQTIFFKGYLPIKIDLLITIFFWIFVINTTNFIDGADGVFGLKLISCSIGFCIHYYYLNELFFVYVSLFLGLYGLIFLKFNLRKKNKLFIIGWLLLHLINKGYLLSAILINLYYLADVFFTLSRRILNNKSIFVRHNDFLFKKLFFKYGILKTNLIIFLLNIFFIMISVIIV